MRVLVVEDEAPLAAALRDALAGGGHAVDLASDGEQADALLAGIPYDLVVLDLGLPALGGLEVCRRARARGADVPILVLTARDATADKVDGLDAGADDYLVKPFDLAELLARVRALLRRRGPSRDPILRAGDLALDPATGRVTRAGREVALPRKERALLELFLRHPGRLLSHDAILDHVWSGEDEPGPDVVRAHVKLLRKAIGDERAPRLIESVYGLGYRLVEPKSAPTRGVRPC